MISIPPEGYTLDASAKTITLLTPFDGIPFELIESIINITKKDVIYHSQTTYETVPVSMEGSILTYTNGDSTTNGDYLLISYPREAIVLSGGNSSAQFDQIAIQCDITDNWTSNDPVISLGVLAHDLTTGDIKIGDGSSKWSELGVVATGTIMSTGGTVDGDLTVTGTIDGTIVNRPFVFHTAHTAWDAGLTNEEIGRIKLQTGETLAVERVELQLKGGGTAATLSVNAYDSTNAAAIGTTTAGAVDTTGGTSGSAALVLIRLTNSAETAQTASVFVSGWIIG